MRKVGIMMWFPRFVICLNCKITKDEMIKRLLDIHGDDYVIKNSIENMIELKPKCSISLYYNSFRPNISISTNNHPSTSMTFELGKSTKWMMLIFESICIMFQIMLLFSFFVENWSMHSIFVIFIPSFLGVFLYLLSYIGLKYSKYRFLKDLQIF